MVNIWRCKTCISTQKFAETKVCEIIFYRYEEIRDEKIRTAKIDGSRNADEEMREK